MTFHTEQAQKVPRTLNFFRRGKGAQLNYVFMKFKYFRD